MIYSTCSMNPIENEAVVCELLRQTKGLNPQFATLFWFLTRYVNLGSVRLVDVSDKLSGLERSPGLATWKVGKGRFCSIFD